MSLHRFLANIDLLHAVFDHLDLLPRPITDFVRGFYARHEAIVARRTLANAALTCRALSEPASKTLWKCLHLGLLPLLKTFSCFKETDGGIASYELDGEISAAEWERFDHLASWVRYIGYPYERAVVLQSSVVHALVKRYQTKGAALLPNLQILISSICDDSLPVNEGAFLALRRFKTFGPTPATLIWTITQISSPNLTSLSAMTAGAKHITDILPVFALPAVQSLQKLHLTVCFDVEASGGMEVAFADLAHSILPLCHLEDVSLEISLQPLSLSDADIVLIKSAWPRLRRLSLSFAMDSEPVQLVRPSLPILVDLALARQLETLDVEMASVTEEDLIQLESISAPEAEHLNMALKWMRFQRLSEYRSRNAFPADVPRLARALHRLFPLLGGL
ncbi:hypothetical protein C8Q74DRAFT_1451054 [Fomes fomentarius]|nr:hypothetical protein C8Q74DRAFT_1451054 [Fomes fomentarius]